MGDEEFKKRWIKNESGRTCNSCHVTLSIESERPQECGYLLRSEKRGELELKSLESRGLYPRDQDSPNLFE